MVRNVAPMMRELEVEDFYLLSGVEHGMRFSEWVDRGKLPSFSRLDEREISYRLDRCLQRDLVEKRTIQYEGYRLRFEGYDALALRTFSERGMIEGVGAPLGVGKESDVYEVRSYTTLALKYHREGYTNFREVKRERDYTSDREHVSWFYTARKAAEREYEALETLYPRAAVPRPEDQNRHAILMEKLGGVELSRARVPDDQARAVLALILEELHTIYELGYVHTDVSEYNIFIDSEGITIFDWPQAVPVDHANAAELLERDVRNVVRYFERKHPKQMSNSIDTRALASDISGSGIGTISDYETL